MPARSKVALIGTGGTISEVGEGPLDLVEYSWASRIMQADELLARFPELHEVADVRAYPFRAIPSHAITAQDWLELNRFIHTVAESAAVDGIVVTHGTATLEETAYFLNLTLKVRVPVVLVGSQRPPTALSSDAGLNLVNAVRVAASVEAHDCGVLVLMNDAIHAARDVTKASNYRLEAFVSRDFGLIGHADADGRVAIYRTPRRRRAPNTEFDVGSLNELARVDISYSHAFSDGAAIRAFVEAGARAIVCATLAPGLTTPAEWEEVLAARRRGVIIVQSSRAGHGRVLSGQPLRDAGVVTADDLNAQKARVLVMLALTATDDATRIQEMFDTY
jgi:L-asparaginase